MQTTGCLSSDQLSRIWTTHRPSTIRELAQKGRLPVQFWFGREPVFGRDPQTIRAILRLTNGKSKPAV
jgi:hypothetical protein